MAAAAAAGPTPKKRQHRERDRPEPEAAGSSVDRKRALAQDEVTFSTDLLRVYYGRFFPYRPFYRWLSYSQDPSLGLPMVQKGFMARREFSFTIENDIYIRYLSFANERELIQGIQLRQPHKIDIGAVFSMPPSRKESAKKDAFHTVERELIFDIDLTDYDEIRTCCSGASICSRCWPFMTVAIKIIDRGLREDFGFKHIFWVYSGRRGVHCWVCDKAARALTNEGRSAVVDYFSAITGSMETKTEGLVSLTVPMHPSLQRASADLEALFVRVIIPEGGQGMLADGQEERWEKVLQFVPDVADLRSGIRKAWAEPGSSPMKRWARLKSDVQAHMRGKRLQELDALAKVVPTIIFAFTYPRIDVNVTKGTNHLLKSPFCVHPKTGRVCVPIVAEDCEAFDPMQVPTIPQLVAEHDEFVASSGGKASLGSGAPEDEDDEDDEAAADAGGSRSEGSSSSSASSHATRPKEAWRNTSLDQYMAKWEHGFLKPLEKDIAATLRRRAERLSAATGDW